MPSIFKTSVGADAPDRAGAAGPFPPAQRPPLVILPADLRREIGELKAAISNQKPATLAIAAPVLISLYSFYFDELRRLTAEALLPFHLDHPGIPPARAECYAIKVLDLIRDFDCHEPASPARVRQLLTFIDNALDGSIDLWKSRPDAPDAPDAITERWQVRPGTRRWWKFLFRDIVNFRIGRPFGGLAGAALDGRGGAVVDTTAPKSDCCQCEICNLEISNPS